MKKPRKSGRPSELRAEIADNAKELSSIPPYRILQEAIQAVPAVKYALGVAGIAAAIAIVSSFGTDLRIAVFGSVVTLVLMVALVVFAKLSTIAPKHFLIPVLALTWSFLVVTVLTAFFLFSSVFFKKPVDLQDWIKPHSTAVLPERIAALPAGDVLKVAYTGTGPVAPPQTENLKLQFEILVKRKHDTSFSPLADGDALASESDEYLIVTRPLSVGYLYLFQVDSSGKTEWFFPKNSTSEFSAGSNPVAPNQIIQSPAAEVERVFYLDKTTGIEHIYAAFSAAQWPELETTLSKTAVSARSSQSGPLAGTVQEPNGLKSRGVGGTRITSSPIDAGVTLAVERAYQGHACILPITSRPIEARDSLLVVERWFKHVDQ